MLSPERRGRIGDAAGIDVLLPMLNDSVPGVQAAAAFALGLLKDARAIPLLLEKVRAVSSTEQGAFASTGRSASHW